MEVKLVALCVLLAAVHALPYERKCVPSVFKNDVIGNVGQVMNGKAMTLSVIGTAYFDYNAKKEVVIQTLKGDGFMINQTYFRDRANVSYSPLECSLLGLVYIRQLDFHFNMRWNDLGV